MQAYEWQAGGFRNGPERPRQTWCNAVTNGRRNSTGKTLAAAEARVEVLKGNKGQTLPPYLFVSRAMIMYERGTLFPYTTHRSASVRCTAELEM